MTSTTRPRLRRGALPPPLAVVVAVLLAIVLAVPLAARENRLNVLLITADDLGLQLSTYGEQLIRTPVLDGLAASGVQFEVAYITQASCSPSRSSMFTGLYPHGTGQYGLTNTGFELHPALRSATLPALLKKAGYRTGIIGKLHVAPESTFPFDYRPSVNTRKVREVAKAAGEFLEGTGDPFFLMVNYSDPHAFRRPENRRAWYFPEQVDGLPEKPIKPRERTIWPFQGIDTPAQRERVANYYNCVLRLDAGVGMLLDVLKKRGHEKDTLIIFLGDHGPPFARGKTTCYEAGLRVPFIVRWPGVSKPMKSKAMVSSVDILPTILDATNIPLPSGVHGRSLRPVLADSGAPWREFLAAEFHCHGSRPFYPRRALRDTRYKLIHNLRAGKARPGTGIDGDRAYAISRREEYEGTAVRRAFDTFADPPEFELYDLEKDPYELDNLAGKTELAEIQKRLTAALMKWRRETEDPFLSAEFMEKIEARTRR